MALTNQHHHRFAGTSITKAVRVGCGMMGSVAATTWNKTASPSFEL